MFGEGERQQSVGTEGGRDLLRAARRGRQAGKWTRGMDNEKEIQRGTSVVTGQRVECMFSEAKL